MTTEKPSATGADDERWLTYLEYDQRVQQAVRRLGALSSDNVDEFRTLLLKDRDRTRINEYEADVIRRLQGEAFVGDEELQRALIVLNAEDPRLGDELKKLVSTTGRPGDLDQTVAAIRSQMELPVRPTRPKIEHPASQAAPASTLSELALSQPAPSKPVPSKSVPSKSAPLEPAPLESVQTKVEDRRPRVVPIPANLERIKPQQVQPPSRTRRLALVGAVLAVGAVGLVFVSYRQNATPTVSAPAISTPSVSTSAPALRAAAEERRVAPSTAPTQVAQHPIPAQSDVNVASADDRTVRPQPDKISPASDVANPPASNAPVPGSSYKVVRGDMLSDIALQAYGDASKYVLIQRANPSLRNRPNRIFYDQVIYLPPVP